MRKETLRLISVLFDLNTQTHTLFSKLCYGLVLPAKPISLLQLTCLMLFFRALISSSRLRTFSSALWRSSASARCCSSFLWSCSRILLYSMRALWCFSCSCLKRNLSWEEREKRESQRHKPRRAADLLPHALLSSLEIVHVCFQLQFEMF